jgi:hypothetical protein
MGHGRYSGEIHRSTTMRRLASETDFGYSKDLSHKPRSQWKVNELLDPKRENQHGDHKGTIIRESLDFEEHPNTTPIVVAFDVTGSMRMYRASSSSSFRSSSRRSSTPGFPTRRC